MSTRLPSSTWRRSRRAKRDLAGFPSADALRADLPGGEGAGLPDRLAYAGPDPRIQLRNEAALSPAEWEAIEGRLRRIDTASRRGPWTLRALTLLAGHPGVRAARLAPMLDRETLAFKRDIRVLKELGLTESLEVGYRLSPRGRAALDRLTQAESDAATVGPGRPEPRASSGSPRRP